MPAAHRGRGLVVYGATGHTGRLIAARAAACWRHARSRREPLWASPPLLAGRSPGRLASLAASLGLPFAVAALEDREAVDAMLDDRAVLLNAAGPYTATAVPLARACLRTRTHYLDVSGELASFRSVDDLNVDATQLGVLLMPGAGFVVTASDYLAGRLARALPGLSTLRLALSSVPALSRGSLQSLVESARSGMSVRRAGRLVSVPVGRLERTFVFDESPDGAPVLCTAVQLPDVVTAPITVPSLVNVETYAEAGAWRRFWYQATGFGAAALHVAPVRRLLRQQIGRLPEKITLGDAASPPQVFVAEGEDHYGALRLSLRLEAADAYAFSAWSAVLLAEQVARHDAGSRSLPGGLGTPSRLFHDAVHAAMTSAPDVRVGTIREEGLGARRDG